MTESARSKKPHQLHELHGEEREFAALVHEIGVRVLNCSADGCLLETNKPLKAGTVAALQISSAGGRSAIW